RIGPITQSDRVAFPLCSTTPETHLRRSINIKFIRRLGEHDRANVPPFHYYVVIAGAFMQFLSDNLANQRQSADVSNAFVHTIVTQMIHGIDIIDQNARLTVPETARNRRRLESLRDAFGI